jgi:hypothetical protein
MFMCVCSLYMYAANIHILLYKTPYYAFRNCIYKIYLHISLLKYGAKTGQSPLINVKQHRLI